MGTINPSAPKGRPSQLVERVAEDEQIPPATAGYPPEKPVSLAGRTGPRSLGLLAGEARIGPDFENPLPRAMREAFEGKLP